MKKLIALLMSLLMISAMVPAMAEETQVLTVASWDIETTAYMQVMKAAYEESHPGVTIEFIDLASQDYDIKLGTMLAGGDTVDVVDVKEPNHLTNWIEQGLVEDLEPYIAEAGYSLDNYTGMHQYYQDENGNQYALPYRSDFWVLYYNKTLFDAAGVDYPTNDMTWEEYKALAQEMTSGEEGVDKIYGSHYHTWLSDVVNWAVCDGVNTLADGEYSDLAYFYQLVQDLEDEGAVMPYAELKAANLHYKGAFEGGNIAMMPMGYWFVATLIQDQVAGIVDYDFGITSVPHLETVEAGSSFGSPTGCAININSTQKDLAWDFISWRCGEEGATAIAPTGARPAYVSEAVAEAMASVEGFPSDDASKAALLPTAVAIEWPTGKDVPAIKTILDEEHGLIMVRDVTIDEGIQSMNERVGEVLGQ